MKMRLFNNFQINGKLFLRLFWLIIISSFVAWFMSLLANPQGRQLEVFCLRMADFWGDATVVTHFVSERDPYSYSGANYPPLPYLIYYVLARVSSVPQGGHYQYYYYQPLWTMLFVLFLFVNLGLLWYICAKQISRKLNFDAVMTGLAICLSGSMLFALERGNTIVLSVLTATIFIFYYDNKLKCLKEIALVCLAVSANIKLTPVVLGGMLIYHKDWYAVGRVCIYGVLLFIFPFLFFDGGIHNILRMLNNINSFVVHDVAYSASNGTGLISGFWQIARLIFDMSRGLSFSIYQNLRVISFEIVLILFAGGFHFQEKWKRVLNLTMILLILPPSSHEYNILYLVPPTVLFLQSFAKTVQPCLVNYSFDKILIFLCFIMVFFVFRCDLSDFFNHRISVLLLTAICSFYSIKMFIQAKHVLPVDFFGKG